MVDLNTLIPPGSSLTLTYAVAINDNGVVVGFGVPPGVPPEEYETKGHAYILIPCDEEHPGVEGCNYRMVDVNVANASRPETRVELTPGTNRGPLQRNNRFHFPALVPKN